ncbi:VCBS repeat-containing protein [Streptomyces sp. NBC_00885]|uniref:FG-GAP repeat domain-containing protein n=1 Tax=Streptomyces sp. NBC_00885 TaxID=2975857 RepID=UPI003867B718|nr:VCBS repeat-containing protein [Streptomyces sp. NBC_00885]
MKRHALLRACTAGRLGTGVLTGALLAGLIALTPPAAAAPGASAAAATVPTWLVPLNFQDGESDARHSCTGIYLSPTRTLATPDCFTGMSKNDGVWEYDSAGKMTGGTAGFTRYRSHPQFNATTRQAGVSVFYDQNPPSAGRAVLAGPSDTYLYTAGSKATFYSWTGTDAQESVRVRHSEQVVVRAGSDCAALLGRSLPQGTICTSPAPDAAPVPAADQCFGDAGGALVAGGKLIAVSATSTSGCVQNGVRLYTAIPTYRAVVESWTRDVDIEYRDSGSIFGREPEDMIDTLTPEYAWANNVDNSGFMYLPFENFVTLGGDLNRNGYTDLLVRHNNGTLYRIPYDVSHNPGARVSLGTGWNRYNKLLAVRDLSGDGQPDVVGRDAYGYLWMHPGTGTGGLGVRKKIGVGWGQYNLIVGRSDLSGDGRADLLVRDAAGDLWLYRGNGAGGFLPRTKAGAGWKAFNAIVASGDSDHDGRQDIIGRTSAGAAYLYNVNNKGSFVAPKLLTASNWKKYVSLS